VGFAVEKMALGQVLSEGFGFPCQFSSTACFFFIIIIREWYNRPISGRRTKWTQYHPIPTKKKLKNKSNLCVSTTGISFTRDATIKFAHKLAVMLFLLTITQF
jgi:hypothetical protein